MSKLTTCGCCGYSSGDVRRCPGCGWSCCYDCLDPFDEKCLECNIKEKEKWPLGGGSLDTEGEKQDN